MDGTRHWRSNTQLTKILSANLSSTWEHPLIVLANEAFSVGDETIQSRYAERAILKRAYLHCSQLTARHSRSFHLASSLLPPDKRSAIRALYAFCRTADDIVDNASNTEIDALSALAEWRRKTLSGAHSYEDYVAVAWTDTRRRFHIPIRYAEQLLDGVARDLRQTRYQTFAELATYAYSVASTVGLMSMYITGFRNRQAIPYAIKLGVALQLTNILRDVGEDWRAGRVYLPSEELADFGLNETDLANGRVDCRWRDFMRFQIERNRRLYTEAWPGIAMLHPDGRLAVAAAAKFYAAILDDIEAHDYNVFTRRAYLGTLGKLQRLPGLWWQVYTLPGVFDTRVLWNRTLPGKNGSQ